MVSELYSSNDPILVYALAVIFLLNGLLIFVCGKDNRRRKRTVDPIGDSVKAAPIPTQISGVEKQKYKSGVPGHFVPPNNKNLDFETILNRDINKQEVKSSRSKVRPITPAKRSDASSKSRSNREPRVISMYTF